jgi:IS30 family transposase
MAGRRISGEAWCEKSGFTPKTQDELVAELRWQQNWTERRIAAHLGVAPSTVHNALVRLQGKAVKRYRYRMCSDCGENFRIDQADQNQLCPACR